MKLASTLLLALAACSPAGDVPGSFARGVTSAGPRTVTTRPLLGTSPRNLLLDPFVTSDASWGHFVGIYVPPATPARALLLLRSFVSQAPAGVSVPVVTLAAPAAASPSSTSLQVIAPFPGGSDPFDAAIWVSAGDEDGDPVAFDAVARSIVVALLPNDEPVTTFPLTRTNAPAVSLAGRQWVSLALATPAPLPRGGWFSISVKDPEVSLQVQAPEVTPAGTPGPHPPPARAMRMAHERAAPRVYLELTRRRP